MRKAFDILILVLPIGVFTARAQQISLSGTLPRQKGDQVHLTGAHHLDIAIPIDTTGQFGVTLPGLPEDFYNLTGVGDVYLAPGDSLVVDTALRFTGRGSLESNHLQESRKAIDKYPFIASPGLVPLADQLPPDTFLHRVREYVVSAMQILGQSDKQYFKEMSLKLVKEYSVRLLNTYSLSYGLDNDAMDRLMVLYRRRNKEPGFTFNDDSASKAMRPRKLSVEQKRFFDSVGLHSSDLNDSALFVHSDSYRSNLDFILSDSTIRDPTVSGLDFNLGKLIETQRLIKNPYVRNGQSYTYARYIIGQSADQHLKDSVYQAYMSSSADAAWRDKLKDLYHHDQAFVGNRPAPDFQYVDTSGREVKLSGLRGKFVYIDVWATWCGPCKEEIPSFKELAAAYKGKNIYFLGLSIDRQVDRAKWAAFVRDNQMVGIQVLADKEWESDFVTQFAIQGIPRFILIDPKGNVVSANEKRPSDEGLRGELDRELGR